MPTIVAAIDPVTRIEGHLKMDVTVDTVDGTQQVVEAKAVGTLFRGFEKILENREGCVVCHRKMTGFSVS